MGVRLFDRPSDGRVVKAIVCGLGAHSRVFVRRGPVPGVVIGLGLNHTGGNHVTGVEAGAVGAVDSAFQDLCPVTGDDDLGYADFSIGCGGPGWWDKLGYVFRVAKEDPNHACPFFDRQRAVFDLFSQWTFRRLGRHVYDIAVAVHLPAVIKTAQTAFFVATEYQ